MTPSYENSIAGLFPEDPVCAKLKHKVRRCLIEIGKSPDAHVYDFDEEFLESHPSPASAFLKAVKHFYDALDLTKRRVFLSECLEVGRIYPFWYYGCMSDPIYRRERKSVIASFKEAFE